MERCRDDAPVGGKEVLSMLERFRAKVTVHSYDGNHNGAQGWRVVEGTHRSKK